MLKIGITGGIGSGKSTICKLFELLGVPVFCADTVAKELLEANANVKNRVVALLGVTVLDDRNLLDRKKIASIVFSDKKKLAELNEIMHPEVAKKFDEWLIVHAEFKYVLKEAAILFESGANKILDKIIVVSCPLEIRIERVVARDKSKREDIIQRINNQIAEEKLIELADFVIVNDEKQSVIEQVLEIHSRLNF